MVVGISNKKSSALFIFHGDPKRVLKLGIYTLTILVSKCKQIL